MKPALIFAACLLIALCTSIGIYFLSAPATPGPDPRADAPSTSPPISETPTPTPPITDATPPTPAPVVRRGRAGRGPIVAPPPPDPRTISFDATIYDLRLPPDQISHLDINALTAAAATPESFEKALALLGTTRPLYRAHQAGNLNEEQFLTITNETPFPAGFQSPLALKNTGATFDLIPNEREPGTLTLDLSINVGILLDPAPTASASGPTFRTATLQLRSTVTPDKPFLLINADATTLDPTGKAVAFIIRVTLGTPQLPPTTQPTTSP